MGADDQIPWLERWKDFVAIDEDSNYAYMQNYNYLTVAEEFIPTHIFKFSVANGNMDELRILNDIWREPIDLGKSFRKAYRLYPNSDKYEFEKEWYTPYFLTCGIRDYLRLVKLRLSSKVITHIEINSYESRLDVDHCKITQGVTLPISDSIWDMIFPPFNMGCGCNTSFKTKYGKATTSDTNTENHNRKILLDVYKKGIK